LFQLIPRFLRNLGQIAVKLQICPVKLQRSISQGKLFWDLLFVILLYLDLEIIFMLVIEKN